MNEPPRPNLEGGKTLVETVEPERGLLVDFNGHVPLSHFSIGDEAFHMLVSLPR